MNRLHFESPLLLVDVAGKIINPLDSEWLLPIDDELRCPLDSSGMSGEQYEI
jgi:hypothetical protein